MHIAGIYQAIHNDDVRCTYIHQYASLYATSVFSSHEFHASWQRSDGPRHAGINTKSTTTIVRCVILINLQIYYTADNEHTLKHILHPRSTSQTSSNHYLTILCYVSTYNLVSRILAAICPKTEIIRTVKVFNYAPHHEDIRRSNGKLTA